MENESSTLRRFCWLALAVSFLLLSPTPAVAGYAGPTVVAKANRHLWPDAIKTPAAFDKASRAALLVYILTLQDLQKASEADLRALMKVNRPNQASVDNWLRKEIESSFQRYRQASATCVANDWTCVESVAASETLLNQAQAWNRNIPHALSAWRNDFERFCRAYAAEQMRLAALLPGVSSEIARFNDQEWNGDDVADRQFFLTFDDGPSPVRGETDATLNMLDAKGKSAVFFLLGENLQNRLHRSDGSSLARLYQNQCVASHGWQHRSHAQWSQWQDSVKRTQSLLNSTLPKDSVLPLFRPPYGQRKADSGAFFQSQSLHVALWNLDSQDWNSRLNADEVVNRIIALMLIKRRGVVLFHDIHPKARAALPALFDVLGHAVDWGDCHQLPCSGGYRSGAAGVVKRDFKPCETAIP